MISEFYIRNKFVGILAIDYYDEYYWTGNYECFISRPMTNHNYYVYICRSGKSGKNKWSANIYQTLSYSNSRDIEIENIKTKTLKEAAKEITRCINSYDMEDKPQKMLDWLENNRKPVFTIKNKEINIIGYAYGNAASEMINRIRSDPENKWLYYHDNIPDYSENRKFMVLCKNFKNDFYIDIVENMGGVSYSAGGLTDDELKDIGLSREYIVNTVKEKFKNDLEFRYIAKIRQKI